MSSGRMDLAPECSRQRCTRWLTRALRAYADLPSRVTVETVETGARHVDMLSDRSVCVFFFCTGLNDLIRGVRNRYVVRVSFWRDQLSACQQAPICNIHNNQNDLLERTPERSERSAFCIARVGDRPLVAADRNGIRQGLQINLSLANSFSYRRMGVSLTKTYSIVLTIECFSMLISSRCVCEMKKRRKWKEEG